MSSQVVLVTGGVASGKSARALTLAEELGAKRAFVATAAALDDEMRRKIAAHQAERGPGWQTFEAPCALARQIEDISASFDVILADCLTMWVSNLMTLEALSPSEIVRESAALLRALEASSCPVVIVTNEVGMGIMPADALARHYQSVLGSLNRDVAGIATRVYLMISGIAQQVK